MNSDEKDNCSVQVAVRIRPLVDSEISRGSTNALEVYNELQQIKIKNTEKAFTFNYVADPETSQDTFYKNRIQKMITNLFKGYNMTILAYGQTGSGKTYSMGTNYNGEGEMGIIPRVVNDIFNYVNDNFAYDFSITVSFMELYQEILYDLLSTKSRDQSIIEIREDLKGMILPGLTEQPVLSANKTLEFLLKGSQGRATSTTNMNSQSSRSHAIFTINISMQRKGNNNENRTAKFQLVDLAGSERPKKTGATGVTFKEGVNINKGLLALGNVISALGDEKQQGNYICYRDSNLTRLLKDSLGGNSITLMIACISPADYNVDETLSTLRYADRARKIKNKPIVNEDPKLAEINRLKKQIDQLRLEMIGKGGPIICQAELDQIHNENSHLKKKNQDLTMKLSATINEFFALSERFSIIQTANEVLNKKIVELKESLNLTVGQLNISVEQNDVEGLKDYLPTLTTMKDLLVDIDCNRKKMEEDIRNHERCNSTISNLSNVDLVAESDINEKQESRAAQQMEMMAQLQEISKSLALKEDLAQQILSQNYGIIDANSVKENEMRIKTLEDEKDKLLQQLKNSQSHPPNSKVAEQRRKQIKDLEHEIDDLKKKLKQQAQLIKMKENDDQKIRKLNMEIHQMKVNKVTLIKNMKQESEKFRVWKLQREKELYKLKDQDRKRQNEINRMETLHTRQQNVLKRKMEQTLAVNKRLQDALSLRKNVQDTKNSGNKIEKLEAWVQHELDVFVKTVDAEASIPILLEDREVLQRQLDQLKANNQFDETIQEQINLRTLHITEMQQQIINSDQENKSKTRWENVQTMAEAKHCLKHLFDLTADIRKKEASNDFKFSELQNTQKETLQKLEQHANMLKIMKEKHQLKLYETKKEYEDKISILCKQLRGAPIEGNENEVTATCLQELLRKCEEELEEYKRNSAEREEQLRCENLQLKQNLEDIRGALQQANANQTPKPDEKTQLLKEKNFITIEDTPKANSLDEEDENDDTRTPQDPRKQIKKIGLSKLKNDFIDHVKAEFLDQTYINYDSDDPNKDPDWKKTPLAKRIVHLRKASSIASERLTIKRKSDGSCSCKGNCAKRTCGCNKVARSCGSLCNCSPEICENRHAKENDNDELQEENAGLSMISFKKPRTDDYVNENRKRKHFNL